VAVHTIMITVVQLPIFIKMITLALYLSLHARVPHLVQVI